MTLSFVSNKFPFNVLFESYVGLLPLSSVRENFLCLWIKSTFHHQCSQDCHSHRSSKNGNSGNRNRNLTTATVVDSLGCAVQRNKHLNKESRLLVNTLPSLSLFICTNLFYGILLSQPITIYFFKLPHPVCMFLAWQNSFTSFT